LLSSIVTSCAISANAIRVSGGRFIHAVSATSARATQPRHVARPRIDALGREQLRDEVAKLDRRAVADEVDLAGLALLGREQEALDDVVDVRRRRQVMAAGEPPELARRNGAHELRHHVRVALAPHEARPHDDCARGDRRRLGEPLRQRVGAHRPRRQRARLVGADDRLAVGEHGLGADVHEAHALRRGEHVLRALHGDPHVDIERVVLIRVRRAVEAHVAAAHARLERRDVVEVAADPRRPERLDLRGRRSAPRERRDLDAARPQRLDQPPADESRPTGDERSLHAPESTRFAPPWGRTKLSSTRMAASS
jgi:hypothetical protein